MSIENGVTQRRFAVMGENAFKIIDKIASNQRVCRLLKYQVADPFNPAYPDVDGDELINKQICIVPKIYDESTEMMSYIVAVFDKFSIDPLNPDFKKSVIRFDIACPNSEWRLNEKSLRPYLLMNELDIMFNQKKLTGIGNLRFIRADNLTLSPQLSGYSMRYEISEFN